jgi:hypothetical protein
VTDSARHVIAPVAPIWRDAARSARDRELVFGERFLVGRVEDAMVFGRAARDGYPGWVSRRDLSSQDMTPTHRIAVARSHALRGNQPCLPPDGPLKLPLERFPLSFGARVAVRREIAPGWVELEDVWHLGACDGNGQAFVPTAHLAPVDTRESDPVSVAELFLGTPYLWGGNSAFGIDCSGLVQIACLACGIPCPGDSHEQEVELGASLGDPGDLRRGDLMFWKGHVAWVADETRILHANAHHMAVAFEDRAAAIARIEGQGGGPVTALKRLRAG